VGFGGVGLLELDIVVDEVVLCWVRKNKRGDRDKGKRQSPSQVFVF
jgi:hypothetical protein